MSAIDNDAGDLARAPVNEASEAYRAWLRRERARRRRVLYWQVGLVVGFLLLWEILPRLGLLNPMLTSFPSALGPVLLEMLADGSLLEHTAATLFATAVGFSLSLGLGVAVAVAFWWWEMVYRVLDPFMVVANALPKIALVPIFYIWLGGQASIYAMAVAIAVFITIIMVYAGFRETDPNKIKLLRTFGASRWQIFRKVVLPANVPTIISTLKVNVGLALVGVIVGEFQAAKAGLGHLIVYGSQIFAMDLVMAAIVVLALISTLMYTAIFYAEMAVRRHRR
jgi:NitT/TauT family transport system permease protein